MRKRTVPRVQARPDAFPKRPFPHLLQNLGSQTTAGHRNSRDFPRDASSQRPDLTGILQALQLCKAMIGSLRCSSHSSSRVFFLPQMLSLRKGSWLFGVVLSLQRDEPGNDTLEKPGMHTPCFCTRKIWARSLHFLHFPTIYMFLFLHFKKELCVACVFEFLFWHFVFLNFLFLHSLFLNFLFPHFVSFCACVSENCVEKKGSCLCDLGFLHVFVICVCVRICFCMFVASVGTCWRVMHCLCLAFCVFACWLFCIFVFAFYFLHVCSFLHVLHFTVFVFCFVLSVLSFVAFSLLHLMF